MAPSIVNDKETEGLKADLDSAKKDIENCKLQKEGRQVASTIAGQAYGLRNKKKVVKEKIICTDKWAPDKCTLRNNDENTGDCYIKELSRGGLIIPAKIFTDFVSKASISVMKQ